MVDKQTLRAIGRCISLNIPFAYVMMPGGVDGHFYASMAERSFVSSGCGNAFVIREFCLDPATPLVMIGQELTVADINALPADFSALVSSWITPAECGTDRDFYLQRVASVIRSLKEKGGKTVISRVIALKSTRPVVDVVAEYFSRFPDTLRFVYFTQSHGLWFGATPELLIDYDARSRTLSTMSLAGTRDISDLDKPWDVKNLREHEYVTDYITEKLRDIGLDTEIYDSSPLRFGSIEHLCDRIRAFGKVCAIDVADCLNPTPALCGTPRDAAYHMILSVEGHRRHCYGGWIGMAHGDNLTAFVNLRSAMARIDGDTVLYNLYAGGGITAQSSPEEEWRETVRKSSVLSEIINASGLETLI